MGTSVTIFFCNRPGGQTPQPISKTGKDRVLSWYTASTWPFPKRIGHYFWKGAWLRSRDPWKIWHTLDYIWKTNKARDLTFGTQIHIDPPYENEVPYFWKGAWPTSRDPLEFFYTLNYISKTNKGREFQVGTQLHVGSSHKSGVQHFWKGAWHRSRDPRKFGIPLSISPKPLKPETSNLVHIFALSLPTRWRYNICERGHGLGHVTLEFLAYP